MEKDGPATPHRLGLAARTHTPREQIGAVTARRPSQPPDGAVSTSPKNVPKTTTRIATRIGDSDSDSDRRLGYDDSDSVHCQKTARVLQQ